MNVYEEARRDTTTYWGKRGAARSCPCGSSKKFKDCCIKSTSTIPGLFSKNVEWMKQQAMMKQTEVLS